MAANPVFRQDYRLPNSSSKKSMKFVSALPHRISMVRRHLVNNSLSSLRAGKNRSGKPREKRVCTAVNAIAFCSLFSACEIFAQVVADTNPATSLETVIDINSGGFAIFGGTRPEIAPGVPGPNLFHSFLMFGLEVNQTASFETISPDPAENIIGRVIGGQMSMIDGEITTAGFNSPNLYLFNPAGVVFGPNATLGLVQSFYVSTADELRFGPNGDAIFSAIDSSTSSLSVDPVASFGFLGAGANSVSVSGNLELSDSRSEIGIVAHDVNIDGAISSGSIKIASIDGPGAVTLDADDIFVSAEGGGTINLSGRLSAYEGEGIVLDSGLLSTTGIQGALDTRISIGCGGNCNTDLKIRSDDIRLSNTLISNFDERSESVLIESNTMTMTHSSISLFNTAAPLTVSATTSLDLIDSSVRTVTEFGGASDIVLLAPTVDISGNSTITAGGNLGRGGNVMIGSITGPVVSNTVRISGSSSITTGLEEGLTPLGIAGDVLITADSVIEVTGGPGERVTINATTGEDPSGGMLGDSGVVSLLAPSVILEHADINADGIFSGVASPITIAANQVALTDVTLTSEGGVEGGEPGSIDIDASERIRIENSTISTTDTSESPFFVPDGLGDISIDAPSISIRASKITAETFSVDAAGSVNITGDEVYLSDGAIISTQTTSDSAAGSILVEGADGVFVNVDEITGVYLAGPEAVVISSSAATGTGDAGQVTLIAESLKAGMAEISTTTASANADAAPATINLMIAGAIELLDTSILASTAGFASAGTIGIEGQSLTMVGGSIESQTSANGNAGDIFIAGDLDFTSSDSPIAAAMAGDILLSNGADILATASDGALGARAGRIALASDGMVLISGTGVDVTGLSGTALSQARDEAIAQIASSAGEGTSGPGAIEIRAGRFALTHASLATTTGSSDGAMAANIDVASNDTVTLTNSAILASTSGSDAAGTITLSAGGALTVSGGLTVSDEISGLAAGVRGIESQSLNANSGAAGSINLAGASVALNSAQITTSTASEIDSAGQEAAITITATSDLSVAATAISAGTTGAAGAGAITMSADGDIKLSGASAVTTSTTSSGSAGSIALTALGDVRLQSTPPSGGVQAQVASAVLTGQQTTVSSESTSAASNAGSAGAVLIEGNAITIDNAGVLATIAGGSTANTAANILLAARGPIGLLNGAQVSADTRGGAPGGGVTLNSSGLVSLSGAGTLASSTSGGAGSAGSIQIGNDNSAVAGLTLADGAAVTVDTDGGGAGGAIDVFSSGDVLIAASRVSSNASNAGNGNRIRLQADNLTLTNRGRIETTATGAGNSGSIELNVAGDLRIQSDGVQSLADQSAILSQATQSTGGSITVAVGGALSLIDSRIESSVVTAEGQGGNVDIATSSLFMKNSQVFAQADQGNGGTITIGRLPGSPKGLFLVNSNSSINADSNAGLSGEINLESPDTALNSVVQPQDARITSHPVLSADNCSPEARRIQSTLVVNSVKSSPFAPYGYFSADTREVDSVRAVATTVHSGAAMPLSVWQACSK